MSKRFREEEELFHAEETFVVNSKDLQVFGNKYKGLGAKHADEITDEMQDDIINLILYKAREADYDIEAKAEEEGMSVNEYILEMDSFYESVMELGSDYIEGMNQAWFYEIQG